MTRRSPARATRERRRLVKYGYVVAIMDFAAVCLLWTKRGVNHDDGCIDRTRRHTDDTQQPWSNGNIGMWGCSATGGSQLQAAAPHLAIFPMSCSSYYSLRVPAACPQQGAGQPCEWDTVGTKAAIRRRCWLTGQTGRIDQNIAGTRVR